MVRTVSVNPTVLRWAREKAGLSVEQAARALGQTGAVLTAWESGDRAPTYRQLETLAYKVYKRPVAIFFFPVPPTEMRLASEFRTLPESEMDKLLPDTRLAIRQARAWQLSIPEVMAGTDLALETVSALRMNPREQVIKLASRVRAKLGITLAEQKSWHSAELGLKRWRAAVERYQIFVFKRSFEQDSVSGFSLDDARYPVIVLHNGTSFTRQGFTLLHELGHICFGVSGVTTRDDAYLGSLSAKYRAIEVNCNQFAAEVLLPRDQRLTVKGAPDISERVSAYAYEFSVSREMVLRRLVDLGEVAADRYDEFVSQWNGDYSRAATGGGGGSYYASQGVYLSRLFVGAAFDQYHRGRITVGELSEHLQMRAQNLGKFEEYVMSHGLIG